MSYKKETLEIIQSIPFQFMRKEQTLCKVRDLCKVTELDMEMRRTKAKSNNKMAPVTEETIRFLEN